MNFLCNKNILVGVTGGIAAYKSADLIRRLREAGASVRVVMTRAAKEFITPLTLQAVSGNPVHEDLFDLKAEAAMGHIELARWADLILIAPATADFIAKLTHGHADDLLSTLCIATPAMIAIAPAMNQQMWHDAATQTNIDALSARNVPILGPAAGSQACGDVGFGRMLEPVDLAESVAKLFKSEILSGKRVLLTAGPTQENIDAVRYLTNHSSGKMGYALAIAAVEAGAKVTLISGPVNLEVPEHVRTIHVVSAMDMYDAVMTEIAEHDIFISAAAVADYRCQEVATHKIAKTDRELTLQLVQNPDIVAEVAAQVNSPWVVGFAAETSDIIERATAKLHNKKLDMIIANQVGTAEGGFNSDQNAVTVLWQKGKCEFPLMIKRRLATQLITLIAEHYHAKNST